MKKENKPQHTQGEWKFFKDPNGAVYTKNKIKCKCATVAFCVRINVSDKEAEANAKRIVKAVNMHDELVSALKKMVDERGFDGMPRNGFIPSFRKKVSTLLKQADQH